MNRIVNVSCSELRSLGRMVLKDHWPESFSVFLVYSLIMGLLPSLADGFVDISSVGFGWNWKFFSALNLQALIFIFFYGPLTVGVSAFMLTLMRMRRADREKLFIGFNFFGKSLSLGIQISIFTFLWSLLFIIPGIIAALSYSQAPFLLYDHPYKSAGWCIKESKRMMWGNKGHFFALRLSFIGWSILAAIPVSVFVNSRIHESLSIAEIILRFIFAIPLIFVQIYISAADTAFYELLTGNLRADDEVPPYDDYGDPYGEGRRYSSYRREYDQEEEDEAWWRK
jgi:uncharacterized membrane protein